jgi:predicted carbohydrate-binding protein with CBM5 and CBM33 domain
MKLSIRMPRPLARVLTVTATAMLLITTGLVSGASAHGATIDPMNRNYSCWKRWGSNFQDPTMATADPMCYQAWQWDTNAMWNWNGLYRENVQGNHEAAVPDGTLCSAGQTGDGRYNSLDVPGNWVATNIADSSNFTVKEHDQAKHGAKYYRVYVSNQSYDPLTERLAWSDLTLLKDTGAIAPGVGTAENDSVLTGVTVSIPVSAPGLTGRHIVYTVWEAAHADQVYYWCADVNFG